MFRVLFGDLANGRLLRLPYLGYSILLGVIAVAIGIGIGAAIGVAENLVGGDIEAVQTQLREQFGVPALVLISVLFAGLFFAGLNLMAKRIRDIGLPGWWTVLAFLVVSVVLSLAVSQQASSGFHFLVWIVLLLVPTGAFGGKSGSGL
ncbi:MAG: DUF805 domain-containing protein [Pseudomonadota bacterium]|nr:DUF805 domain-containing protein [Pseudomonadota bacterium]